MIDLVNFNKPELEILTSFNTCNTGNKLGGTEFLNILEDKMESMELSDDNSIQKEMKEKIHRDRMDEDKIQSSYQPKDEKSKIKKTDSLSGNDKEDKVEDKLGEKIENKKEIELNMLKDVMEQITLLLKQLKTTDTRLYKQILQEYHSIKKGMTAIVKNKILKDDIIICKLLQLLQELKKVLKSDKQKVSNKSDKVSKGDLIKNNDKIEIVVNKEEKNNKKVKLNNNDNTEEKVRLLQKDNKFLNLKKIKIRKNSKNNELSNFLNKNSNNESSPVKLKLNNKILNNFEINNLHKQNFDIEVKENLSLRKTDIGRLIQKVTNKIKVILAENKSEVVMNLKPEFLGKVQIKLEFKGKALSAKFIVDNIYAEKVFKDSLTQLKVNLQNMGFEVQNFDVKLNEKGDSNLNQSFNDFQGENQENSIINTENEDELIPLMVENYDNLAWLAQNVNVVI